MSINLVAKLSLVDNLSAKMKSIDRTIQRTERATNSFNSSLQRTSKSGASSFNGTIKAVGGLVTAIGGAIGIAKTLDATLGEAMRYQQQEVLVEAMFDDKKASAKYAKMVQKMAQDSPIMDTSTMMGSSKAFVGITKSLPALKQAWKVAEKLSIMDPEQGLQGAVYAMKELASGDGVSMAERFEVPKKVVNSIKNLSFDEQLVSIQQYLDKVGITDKTVQKMGGTTMSKWNQIKEKLQSTFRNMGTSGNSQIGKAFDGILAGLDKGSFNKVAKQIDEGLGTALSKLANYVKTIDFVDLGNKASTAFDKISKGVKWISDNFNGIKETVIGVGIAVVAFKGIMAGLTVISTINTLMKAYRTGTLIATAAQWNLNAALLANPIGLIVVAIAALIGIIVVLVRNWDTVTKKTKQFWRAIGGGSGAIRILMGPLGILIGAAIDLAKNWDSTKSVWENVWGAIKRSAAESVNSVIGGINEMIKMINKLPGVNVPVIAKVDWGGTPVAPSKKLPKKNPQLGSLTNYAPKNYGGLNLPGHKGGLNRVPYDGYVARLHEGERIQTRDEVNAERNATSGVQVSFAGANFHVRQESDIESIAKALANEIFSRRKVVG
ncbi:hypothetical protein [Rummeliibacillus pycnus]|uniref:hypothetical protein n=1 Tax=Rummeliibacillus pycnus TaxID=101070 RepID=UPI000C9AC6A7|nr:hypothetical protein [Rummeliibacillus pycnus]